MSSQVNNVVGNHILVLVDGSQPANWALHCALMQMDKAADLLVICSVVQLLGSGYGYTSMLQEQQDQEECRCKGLLRRAAKEAKEAGVKHLKLNVTYGSEVGEAVVSYLEKCSPPIDIIYVGRRSIGGFERFMLGSVSQYLVENAQCNVVVVKTPFGPEELHVAKSAVVSAEEEERQRRIAEYEQRKTVEQSWLAKKHIAEELHHDDDE